jgi:outer membrane protein
MNRGIPHHLSAAHPAQISDAPYEDIAASILLNFQVTPVKRLTRLLMHRFVPFLILSLCSPALLGQRPTVTLATIVVDVERNAEQLKIQQLTATQAALATRSTARSRLPKLDLTASYSHVSEVGRIHLSIPGLPIPMKEITFGDGNIYETALNLSVPLFTGFRLSTAVELQQAQENVARQTFEGNVLEARTAATMQYRAAQLARSAGGILDAQMLFLEESQRMRKALLAQGQALAIDTLMLSTRIAQLHVDRANADAQYDNAVLRLMQLAGRIDAFDVEQEVPDTSPLAHQSLEALLQIAFEKRYEFKNIESSKRIADLSAQAAKSAYYPSVVAQAALKYGRPGVDQVTNEWMDYYVLGARLEWNLWSWGADKAAVERLSLEREKAELKESQFRMALRTQIGTTLNELAVRRRILDVMRTQIEQERLKQTLVVARSREGLATASEIVDAETALTTVLLRREQTRIEYALKLVELAAAVGVDPE